MEEVNMLGESIRRRLAAGELVYGTHVTQSTNAVAASAMASAGLDYVFLCAEHMPIDRAELSSLCCLYAGKGISPVVRISNPCPIEAAMALDGGAQGICAPYVETVDQVRDIVGAVHYRPIKGQRLDDYLSGRRPVPQKMTDFYARFNRHHHVVIGIESVPAYERLDELISVKGVNAVFIGPHDMTVSLEIPEEWKNPLFLNVIEDIIRRCHKAGIGVGVHAAATLFSMDYMRKLVGLGMNWILDAADIGHAIKALSERRAALGVKDEPADGTITSGGPQSCATVSVEETSSSELTSVTRPRAARQSASAID